jgi:hypothetical protein
MGNSSWPRIMLTRGAFGGPVYHAALLLICLVVLCACAAATQTISAPTIAADSTWRLAHCAGRRCPWSEDTLVADDVSVRMETNAGTIAGMFHVIVDLASKSDAFEFDPSAATVSFRGGRTLHATGVSCARQRFDSGGGRPVGRSTGQTHARQSACYHLVFDTRPPAVTEEFIVRLHGLTRNGEPVHVPDIVFRPQVVTPMLSGVSE